MLQHPNIQHSAKNVYRSNPPAHNTSNPIIILFYVFSWLYIANVGVNNVQKDDVRYKEAITLIQILTDVEQCVTQRELGYCVIPLRISGW